MNMPLPAAIGTFIGAFLGYPVLGYVVGSRLSRATPPEAMVHEGEFVIPAATVYGTNRIGGNVLWSIDRVDRDGDDYKRFSPTCPQCGGPHEAHATVCLFCLTPKAGVAPLDLIEVTTLEDHQPRYIPTYKAEPPVPTRK